MNSSKTPNMLSQSIIMAVLIALTSFSIITIMSAF